MSALTEVGSGQLALSGPLTLSTIPGLARQAQRLFKGLHKQSEMQPRLIEIDLSGVERSSSAGIALLIEWVDQAGRDGIKLHFQHCPEALQRIALFSNVDHLLGLEASQHG